MELFVYFRGFAAVAMIAIGGYSAQADGAGNGAAAISDTAHAAISAPGLTWRS